MDQLHSWPQPLQNNYGGLLQNWALQQTLIRLGHKPVTIDWEGSRTPLWYTYASRCKYFILRNLGLSTVRPIYRPDESERSIISQHTQRFVDENICRTKIVRINESFLHAAIEEKVDAFIVGSDQVWRPCYSKGRLIDMFLGFADSLNIKRVAYAVSFGVDKWEYSEETTRACAELVKKFNLITVREDSAIGLCNKYLNIKASQVLDPTLLLEKKDYIELIRKYKEFVSPGNLFCYILDQTLEKQTYINKLVEKYRLIPFDAMPKHSSSSLMKSHVKFDIDNCIYPPVTQWISSFMDAKMVICDSFHGCVFSIIFNKPFWVLANNRRGNTRFSSLLKLFGLENRMIDATMEIDINDAIDWNKVNETIERLKEKSISLLQDGLEATM